MTEGQMVFLFCVVYSGALSLVIWLNLVMREKIRVHLEDPEFRDDPKFKQGA